MKEKLPSLLASKQGLYVACAMFQILDAKDRKLVVKSVQEPLKEMATNKIAHLFLLHILNNLDDTVMSKKKILQDLILTIDENKSDENFARIFIGMQAPESKRYFADDEIEAFNAYKEHSTSKKDQEVRRKELLQIFTKPLETFFEENMLYSLLDCDKSHLLPKTIAARLELGNVKESDCIDEMMRQLTKKQHYDGKSSILLGHPVLHRVLKELVKHESGLKDSQLDFCKLLASTMLKHTEECLETRAVFIFVEFLEHDNTKALVQKDLLKF